MNTTKPFTVDADERAAWEQEERRYWENEERMREEQGFYDREDDPFLSDCEADADALASAGWGTDEDYGGYDGGDW